MAWHYFAYDCDFGNLTDWEIQTWRAFDQYERKNKITEKPLTSSSIIAKLNEQVKAKNKQ